MAVNQYIGARYVPLINGQWNANDNYEPLTVVLYQGGSYTSRCYVPAGISPENETYWALTGNYNAQIEQYRQEVKRLQESVNPLINKKYIMIGDSWNTTETPSGGTPIVPWGPSVAGYLGLSAEQYYNIGNSGSGFVGGTKFLDLLKNATITDNEAITDIVVIGGLNDVSYASQVYNAVAEFREYCKSAFPNAMITIALAQWNTNRDTRELIKSVYSSINNNVASNCRVVNDAISIAHLYSEYQVDGSHLTATGTNILSFNIANFLLKGVMSPYLITSAVNITLKNEVIESTTMFLTNELTGNIINTELCRIGSADIIFKAGTTLQRKQPILIGSVTPSLLSGNKNNITSWNTTCYSFDGSTYQNLNLFFYLDYFDLYMIIEDASSGGLAPVSTTKFEVVPQSKTFSVFDC